MNNTLQNFCGLPNNGSYVVYIDSEKTFGRCFLWTAFSYTSHVVFAIVCAYQLGVAKTCPLSRRSSCLALGACVVSLLSAMSDASEVVLSYTLHRQEQHVPAYVLSKAISFTSWSMCFLLQRKTTPITQETKKKNKYVLVTFVLVLLSSAMHLQFVLRNMWLNNVSIRDISLDYVGVLVDFSLNIFFFVLCGGIALSKVSSHSYGNLLEESEGEEQNIYLGNSEETKNIFSKLVFWWSGRLLRKGYKYQLKGPDDLFFLPNNLSTKGMKTVLIENLRKEKERLSDDGKDGAMEKTSARMSLFKILNRCFGKVYYSIGVLKFLTTSLQLLQPVLVNRLVSFVSDKNEPIVHGYYYALAFLLSTLFSVIFDLHYNYNMYKVNLRVRAALVSVIYEKSLSVRASSLSKFSSGKIVNLMSTDTDRVRNFANNFHECWNVPFQLIVCMYLLYQQVGVAFLPALLYCILVLPLAKQLVTKVKENQIKVLAQRDKRLKMICEVLFGIRVIKYNAWEKHFAKVVNAIRNRELKYGFAIKLMYGGVACLWGMTVSVMSILTFGTLVLMGHQLTAAMVFTVMSVINRLLNPLNSLSFYVTGLIDAWVSLKRIEEYLCLPEICLEEYYANGATSSNVSDVEVESGTFRWNLKEETMVERRISANQGCCFCCRKSKNSIQNKSIEDESHHSEENDQNPISIREAENNTFELKDISIRIKQGKLIGITGRVGSGKSSIFACITAEMEKYGGRIQLSDRLNGIALVTQEPWIQHLSIRDNILFGSQYDVTRYNNVLDACALNEDINLFPAGDLTEIGENGVNLSGGQKARIALARAVYQDKDMYLLDDPISAVDEHVAMRIYENCIMGLLKNKTRVLCTHHTKYLCQSDHVIVLDNGIIETQGNPSEVLKTCHVENEMNQTRDEEGSEEYNRKLTTVLTKAKKQGKLVADEEKRIGRVAFKVYKLYWTSVGNPLAAVILTSIIFIAIGKNLQDWWLSYWVTNTGTNNGTTPASHFVSNHSQMFKANKSDDLEYYLPIYGYIILVYLFFSVIRAITNAFGSIRASKKLHNLLLGVAMITPVSFFDVTPVGRILNRFSTDISEIDGRLPFLLQMTLRQTSNLIGTLVLTCISLPWFTALLVPVGLVYYWIQLVYRRSSRELKRIGAVVRSPIYEHFTETLSGYMVIRAFRESERFIASNELKLNTSQRVEYNEQLAALWLTFRLDLIGVFIVTAVSLLAVLEHHYGTTSAGVVGLAIMYSIQITPVLGRLVTLFTETEKQMVRVERISQYVDETPREKNKSIDVSPSWPNCGNIVIDGVYLRYREDLPFALQDLTLEIKAGEKVGICGRTGSGKSTLLKVLFKIVDISSGRICIDDVNINDIDYSILRSRMSIIPQDPFLFADTIYKNLDPAGEFSTHDMLDVLEKCHLKKLVEDMGGLEGIVEEKGNNLSAGQKQLLCLARALLKKSKIICIDEATASVDFETDILIQATIREEFIESTVLTIAHRMNTIIDSDRVLVMNAGKVAEFARPEELLADTNSEFYALVNKNTSTNS